MNDQLTRSQREIVNILRTRGRNGMTPNELMERVSFAPRTVRHALRKLLRKGLADRIPNLSDMRQHIYLPSER
ncbi:MarR family transcriptional regulator [Candidatus Thorarchaeota archaeon]|nr:MAG: MarR family transcriptional regulator [Candidatus Thorarchaeota archaeon]